MNRKLFGMLSLLVLLGMFLGACGGQATVPEEVEEAIAPEVEVVEEEEAEEEMAFATDEALDAAFTTFLADMVAYNTISLEAVNEMLAEEPPPFLLDVRSPSEVEEKGYIEGAAVIPLRDLAQNIEYLPSEDTPIVSYCGSGWRCTIATAMLEALGWETVYSLKGGSFGGWAEAGYPVATGLPEAVALNVAAPDPALVATIDTALSNIPDGWGVITAELLNQELIENPDLTLLDVRRAEELDAKGYIEGSIHIPLEEFIANKDQWPADKDASIVIYCGSGHRSTLAMATMWAYGYTDVRSLKGGFGGWASEGYPVVGGEAALDAAFTTFLGDMVAYNTISLEAVNEMLAEEPPPFLLDVRSPSEVEEKGYIEGAAVIPLRDLAQNIEYLPSEDTPIVSYCGSGWRCTIATAMLEGLGWETVYSLKGGSFGGWAEAGYPVATGLPEAVALNVAAPDPALVGTIDTALTNIPEGWGVITAEQLNQELIENPDWTLIDVRRAEELEEKGMIEDAIHVPLEEFIANKDQWPADKDAPIVVYCGSGHRSTLAMAMMWANGYTDVRSLKGGFGGWVSEGYPVVEFTAMQ